MTNDATNPRRSTAAPAALLALVLLTVGLAGCLGGSAEEGPVETTDEAEPNITADNVGNYTNESTIKVKEDTQFDPSSTVHAHDYWEGRTEVTIVDGHRVEIDWQQWAVECSLTASCHLAPTFLVDVPVDPDDPRFVYPGTASLDVTLEWQSEGLEDVSGEFKPIVCVTNRAFVPNCRTDDQSTNATRVYDASGETWTIDDEAIVNRVTADPPHALKSNWRFLVRPCAHTEPGGRCFPQGVPNVGMTEFTMTVTIHRAEGDLPIDPPHFAFYGESDELGVLTDYTVDTGRLKGTQQPWMTRTMVDQETALWRITGAQVASAAELGMSEQPVVPIETRELIVKLTWDSGTRADLELRYRSAADNWQDPWRGTDGRSCGDGCLEYTIPVTKQEADSPYALQTQWEFGVFHVSDAPMPMTDYEVTLDVLARR